MAVSDLDRPGLVATDLWLRRGDREVLGGVSVALPRSCVTAILAPSGAGKSTLLRCMTRLLDPDRGSITLAGTDVRALPPRELRRRVGLVAQHAVMLPGTVAENLRYGLVDLAAGAEDALVGALDDAGLGRDFASRPAAELSGGEQARVAVARAIIREPELLLLDEPTAALDAATAARIGETLRTLAGRGLGIAMAVHDVAFAERFADRIVHLGGTPEIAP